MKAIYIYIDTFVYKVILLHRSRLSKTGVKSLYYKVLIYKISIWSCNFDEEYDLDWSNQFQWEYVSDYNLGLGVSNNLTAIDILEHKTKTKTHYCFEVTTIRQNLDKS
jgi:hypothetical protein